ncbi:DUF4097 family beta strand repeat-containing protein [Actinoplanes siamensis]|uniref:DUF4097 domain-containing protein n=1 Tax=Actinoplanes siamensis TaxID=1223317 RepID=A0A919TL98_9ACTN|nr:DUF4097 family beta strand repeat-containing protein [Actinoplanes siamensis]GIF06936.1 hypothetical protein Asi03nite_44740 [Actinoplanes siamensis]
MPKFDTPASIFVNIEFGVGNVRIAASDRTDTVVDVRPTNESDESDVRAAADLRVEYANGRLDITGPKRLLDFSKKSRSADVTIELPTDSRLDLHLVAGEVRTTGRLGECKVKTTGNVQLEQTGPLRLHTGAGNITADSVRGDADISTGTGKVQVGDVDGAVQVRNSNGDTTVDAATGEVRVRNANGDIEIERLGAGADVKTSNGGIRLGELVHGSVTLGTATGDLDIGIAAGTAAWLEVTTGYGHVRNLLEQGGEPAATEQSVEVRGRTAFGDITIHRSSVGKA